MRKFMKQLKNERGLTLVELLAVVVILGIVGTIAVVSIGNVIENSKKDAHVANALQVISAAKLAEASGIKIGENYNLFKKTETGTGDSAVITTDITLETLDSLVDPWTKEVYDSATVSSIDGTYSVTLSTSGDNKECQLSGVNEETLLKGREACQPVSAGG